MNESLSAFGVINSMGSNVIVSLLEGINAGHNGLPLTISQGLNRAMLHTHHITASILNDVDCSYLVSLIPSDGKRTKLATNAVTGEPSKEPFNLSVFSLRLKLSSTGKGFGYLKSHNSGVVDGNVESAKCEGVNRKRDRCNGLNVE